MSWQSLVNPENVMDTLLLEKIASGIIPSMNHPMERLTPQLCGSFIAPPRRIPGLNFKLVPVSLISTTQPRAFKIIGEILQIIT